jgi:hypothetical protein
VIEVPGGGDDHVARHIHRTVVGGDRPARDGRDHVGRSDHGPPERVVAEDGLGDQIVHQLLRLILVHRDLLEHDFAFGVDLGERRGEDHVAHHVDRRLEVLVGDPGVDDGVLARRRRVQFPAEPVEDLGDLLCGVLVRPFEQQVLDEVRDAGALITLVTGAGADPVAERDGSNVC